MRTAEQQRSSTSIPVWTDPGLRFAAGHGLLIGVLLIAGAAHLALLGTEALVVLSMAWVAAGLPLWLRPLLGLVAWAFVTGFVVNGFGELTFAADDVSRLLLLVLGVTVFASAHRRHR